MAIESSSYVEAERMPGWVEHDPDMFLRLDVGKDRAGGDSPAHCLVQVCDRDVQMLGRVLSAVSSGPHGPGELRLAPRFAGKAPRRCS